MPMARRLAEPAGWRLAEECARQAAEATLATNAKVRQAIDRIPAPPPPPMPAAIMGGGGGKASARSGQLEQLCDRASDSESGVDQEASFSEYSTTDPDTADRKHKTRTHRRNLRRTPTAAADSNIWSAATSGDAAALREALDEASIGSAVGETSVGEVKSPKGSAPLLHEAARGGHLECVRLLIERGADIEVRSQGLAAIEVARQAGHAAVVRLLKEHEYQLSAAQAARLLARQAEARSLAERAEVEMQSGEELGAAVIAAAQAAATLPSAAGSGGSKGAGSSGSKVTTVAAKKAAAQLAGLRDRACRLACEHLERHGLADRHAPAAMVPWLGTHSARDLLLDLAEALPGRETPPEPHVSASELALSVRVAQLRLREAASAALGRVLGQDDLVPLLEQVRAIRVPSDLPSDYHLSATCWPFWCLSSRSCSWRPGHRQPFRCSGASSSCRTTSCCASLTSPPPSTAGPRRAAASSSKRSAPGAHRSET